MFNKNGISRVLVCLLSLTVAAGVMTLADNKVKADDNTVHVSSAEELTEALKSDKTYDHIIIDEGFDVPCIGADQNKGTSYFTITRSMTIEGDNPDVKIKRACEAGQDNSKLQSLFGIRGSGSYTENKVEVTFKNLTLDGGAVFGTITGYSRTNEYNTILNQGAGGRSLVDVYCYGILNLEEGLTIQNSICTYSLSSASGDSGSWCFGGAVRVDFDDTTGGGTVNVKAGSCIKDCVASNKNGKSYGGALGAYTHARLNVYGGTIENCSAYYGGAVGCTYRSGSNNAESGTFRMYGGLIKNCSADKGGAICAQGTNADPNCLYGGTIDSCSANTVGSALALGGDNEYVPPLSITPYSENGPLFIINCPPRDGDSDLNSIQGKVSDADNYVGICLGAIPSNTTFEGTTYSVTFKKFKDDTDNYAVLTVKEGQSLGESFPADPVDNVDHHFFAGWNLVPDGSGDDVDENYMITKNLTVYARWVFPAEFTTSPDLKYTYGESDKQLEIIDAASPYGGEISYSWYKCDGNGSATDKIDGATDSVYLIPKQDVGSYQYSCYVHNYIFNAGSFTGLSRAFNVTIEPKTINLDWSDLDFIADGKIKLPKAEVTGILDGDEVTVEVSGGQTSSGKYVATAKLVGKDSGNYVIAEGDESKEFTIASPTATATPTTTATPTATATPSSKPSKTPAKPTTAEPTNASSVILSLDKESASVICGKTVSLNATLRGSDAKISWKSSDTKVATVDANGNVTTKMAGTVTITATAAGQSATATVTVLYKDVTSTKDFWYAPTNYLTGNGVVKGYAKQTEFRPANNCTRAQMVTFIWRLMGEPAPKAKTCKFSDVKAKDYFYKACIWGNENHIVEGYKDGTFGPQIVCARKHAVTFLWRLANKPSPKSKDNKFSDVKKSDYFYTATLWASEKGILAGYSDGTFRPDGDCLRRQMVTFLYKYDKYVNGKG